MPNKIKKNNRNKIRRLKYSKKLKTANELLSDNRPIYLSDSDRITYKYKRDPKDNKISEVVNVSLDIKIKDRWMTIKRYDSSHGFLHKHTRISIDNNSEIVSTGGVRKKGKHSNWLTWAIKDIRGNFWNYKVAFLKRSGQKLR